jgi:hypothetical protein
MDERAYYVQRGSILDGPFCLSCFEQNHKMTRLISAPKPEGADGTAEDWVQCGTCQTPFRSERIGQYLNPRPTAVTPVVISPEDQEEAKPAKTARKPRSQARPPKEQRPAPTKATGRRKTTR